MRSRKVLPQGGGNADRLRRAEAKAAAKRRSVPPARDAAPRARRKDSLLCHPPISVRTGTARRSNPQKEETAREGSDGEHSAPSHGRAHARAKLTSASGRNFRGRRLASRPLFF